jgi:undecaprenyl-diphosphatase
VPVRPATIARRPSLDVLTDLHLYPPMTMARVHAAHRLLLPLAGAVFLALALGAVGDWLPWDGPITRWVIDARTPWLDGLFRRLSFLGSTRVVLTVSAAAAAVAWRRCPRLAVAILVIALARPLTEWALKELVSRDRPIGDRMVRGRGYSFPSGHPMATAASWGVLPLVVALYTRRRLLWWLVAVGVWAVTVGVAISRVWLGVHWSSDVIGGLLLAVLGVAGAERLLTATHGGGGCASARPLEADHVDEQVVDRPVLDASAKLAPVRLVEGRLEDRPEPPVVLHFDADRTDEVGADLEPAGEEQCLHHLGERLTRLAPSGAGVDHQRGAGSRMNLLVGRQRRLPQGEDAGHADCEADDAECEPGRFDRHV